MDGNNSTDNQTLTLASHFKAFTRDERVKEYYKEVIKLNTKGPRLVHDMILSYEELLPYIEKTQVNNLDRPLEKLKRIKSLFLYLDESFTTKDWIVFKLSQQLKSLSSLQTLEIQAPYSRWISYDGVISIVSALGSLKNLSKLILYLIHRSGGNDGSFNALFKSLRKLRNLKSFELNLNFNKEISQKDFKTLAQSFKHLKFLKELDLSLADVSLETGNILTILTSGLQHLASSLNKLQINFASLQNFAESHLHYFMSSLKDFQQLTDLHLYFTGLDIGASALHSLSTSLQALTKLKILRLTLSQCQTLGSTEMEFLAQAIGYLTSLESLTLSCGSCINIDNEALEKLSSGFKSLVNLSTISLDFYNCKKIGDSGVESLTNELGGLPNLKIVSLNFTECQAIQDAYYNGLKMNKNIKSLTFHYKKL